MMEGLLQHCTDMKLEKNLKSRQINDCRFNRRSKSGIICTNPQSTAEQYDDTLAYGISLYEAISYFYPVEFILPELTFNRQ